MSSIWLSGFALIFLITLFALALGGIGEWGDARRRQGQQRRRAGVPAKWELRHPRLAVAANIGTLALGVVLIVYVPFYPADDRWTGRFIYAWGVVLAVIGLVRVVRWHRMSEIDRHRAQMRAQASE